MIEKITSEDIVGYMLQGNPELFHKTTNQRIRKDIPVDRLGELLRQELVVKRVVPPKLVQHVLTLEDEAYCGWVPAAVPIYELDDLVEHAEFLLRWSLYESEISQEFAAWLHAPVSPGEIVEFYLENHNRLLRAEKR